jgi:hypothetical protein
MYTCYFVGNKDVLLTKQEAAVTDDNVRAFKS